VTENSTAFPVHNPWEKLKKKEKKKNSLLIFKDIEELIIIFVN
jgi:hypothetical protein